MSPELNGQNSPRVEAQAVGLEISSTLENQRYGSPTSAQCRGRTRDGRLPDRLWVSVITWAQISHKHSMDGRVVVEEGKLDGCRPSPADFACCLRPAQVMSLARDTAQAVGVEQSSARGFWMGPVALCPKAERRCPESSAPGRAKQAKEGSLRRGGLLSD